MSPSAHHSALVIQELIEWFPKHCVNGTNGPSATPNRPFMPLPVLEDYLKAESRTSNLLRALYSEREPHIDVEDLERRYIRVFTILTLIGKGSYIETFLRYPNLLDTQLPFLDKPAHFPTDLSDPKFWESFHEMQFAFCAHHFHYNKGHAVTLEELCILPIISKELLAQGGSAAVYKIKLHSSYDQLNPAFEAHGVRPANTYVLKTYNTKDAKDYFENEVDAFRKLATKNGIEKSLIQFFGGYKQGDTYNILLEYADCGTLEDFFQNVTPPSLGEDIEMFWGRLFNVIQALSHIHKLARPDGFRGPDILIGWHQDVKPSNILIISGKSSHPYDVEFKLADLGLSHFKRTLKLDRTITDRDTGGTKEYGAPECHRSDEFLEECKLNVKPSIDIWSFGCVCSEAAVWVVLGMSELINYRSLRRREICRKATFQDGCCFHDGEKALETVGALHNRLLKTSVIRAGDHVTRPILEHMVDSMLEVNPDDRHDAIWLWRKYQKILTEVQSELKQSHQQTPPRPVTSGLEDTPFFGPNMPETPPPTLHRPAHPYNENCRSYGPPPNYPQHSLNLPVRSFSVNPKRQSDNWHEHSIKPSMAPGPFNRSSSPPTAIRQQPGASPMLGMYHFLPEQAEIRASASDATTTRPEEQAEKTSQNVNRLSYSLPYGSRDVNPIKSGSAPRQASLEFSPPRTESSARAYQSDAAPALVPYLNTSALEPQLESNQKHSNVAITSTDYEASLQTSGFMSAEPSQRSPPNSSPLPPMADRTAAEPPVPMKKAEKPYVSYKIAKDIRKNHGVLSPPNQHLLDRYLKSRDHVFLIDDSQSMKDHWDDVISLFSVFAYFAKKLDKNELELYFTVSTSAKKTFKDTTPVVSHLRNMNPKTYSNINMSLDAILRKYQAEFGQKGFFRTKAKEVKPLSLYVFTDAAWQGSDAVPPIEAMIEKLREHKLPKEQVGIQFVRFGNDPTGIKRLKYLDSGLREKYTKDWDIVDTVQFQEDSNIMKMFLGPIFEWFDDDDG